MKKIMVSLVSVMLFATFALADNPQTPAKEKSTSKDTKGTTMTAKSGQSCTKDGKTCAYGMKGKDGCCKEGEAKSNGDKGKK